MKLKNDTLTSIESVSVEQVKDQSVHFPEPGVDQQLL